MVKAFGLLFLFLLAVGIGFTLYLPPYPMEPNSERPLSSKIRIITDTLHTPIAEQQLRLSVALLNTSDKEYGLRLGIFSDISGATQQAAAINNQFPSLPSAITVFS